MNAYLATAAALAAMLLPCAAVAALRRSLEGAVALQLAGVTSTLALICLALGLGRPVYLNIAVLAALLTWINGLVLARMLGHRT